MAKYGTFINAKNPPYNPKRERRKKTIQSMKEDLQKFGEVQEINRNKVTLAKEYPEWFMVIQKSGHKTRIIKNHK